MTELDLKLKVGLPDVHQRILEIWYTRLTFFLPSLTIFLALSSDFD